MKDILNFISESLEFPMKDVLKKGDEVTILWLDKNPLKKDSNTKIESIETAKVYISMGYKIGIGGVVTFKNSNLYKVVDAIGIKNILLETDSPYLTPVPYRGQKNSSKYIPLIAEKVAEILSLSIENVSENTLSSTYNLFDLK